VSTQSQYPLAHVIREHRNAYLAVFADLQFVAYSEFLPRDTLEIRRTFRPRQTNAEEERRLTQSQHEGRGDTILQRPSGSIRDIKLVEDLIARKKRRLLITGEGGIGKTEFSRHLAWQLANHLDPNKQDQLVPVWVDLRGLARGPLPDQLVTERWIIEGVRLGLLAAGKLAFILDGLDELNLDWDWSAFACQLSNFVKDYPSCTFVLTSRSMPLGRLAGCFRTEHEWQLQWWSANESVYYVRNYFRHHRQPEKGRQLVTAISSGAMKSPLWQQPFMLAFACRLLRDPEVGIDVLGAPALLLEKGLRQLFETRRQRMHPNRGSSLQIDADTCLDSLGVVFANSVHDRYTIDSTHAARLLARETGISLCEAEDRLDQLAPSSGVLCRTESGKYRSSNRMIAEFLAAHWITRAGTRPDRINESTEIESQICRFYSDYVWSVEHRELLRWVCHFLAIWRPRVLIRIGRWLVEHLRTPPQGLGDRPWHDDQQHTLLYRFLDLLSVLHPNTRAWSEPGRGVLTADFAEVLPPEGDWFGWIDHSAFGALCTDLKKLHCRALEESLSKVNFPYSIASHAGFLAKNMPESRERMGRILRGRLLNAEMEGEAVPYIEALRDWAGDEKLAESLRYRIHTEHDPIAFEVLAEVLATGWPGHQEFGSELCSYFAREQECLHCERIAQSLATGWKANPRIGQVIYAKLASAKSCSFMSDLAPTLVDAWPEYRRKAGEILRKKLTPELDASGVSCLADTLLKGWPGYKHDVGTILRTKISSETTSRWVTSMTRTLRQHWGEAREVLTTILAKVADPKCADDIGFFAEELAMGWAGDNIVGEILEDKLARESDDAGITRIALALAKGWPSNSKPGEILRNKLAKEPDGLRFARIADALAAGWAGDNETGDLIWRRLVSESSGSVQWELAQAILRGWPMYKDALGKHLRTKLKSETRHVELLLILSLLESDWTDDSNTRDAIRQRLSGESNKEIVRSLSQVLAKGWRGDVRSLRTLLEKCPDAIDEGFWPEWVILIGPECCPEDPYHGLRPWANRCSWETIGDACHLENLPNADRTSDGGDIAHVSAAMEREDGPQTARRAFVLAPREKLRPGLDPALDFGDYIYAGEDLPELAGILCQQPDAETIQEGKLVLALYLLRRAIEVGIFPPLKKSARNVTEPTLCAAILKLHEDELEALLNIEPSHTWPYQDRDLRQIHKGISHGKPRAQSLRRTITRLKNRKDLAPRTHNAIKKLLEELGHKTPKYQPDSLCDEPRDITSGHFRQPGDYDLRDD
jgi:hypothetical protein